MLRGGCHLSGVSQVVPPRGQQAHSEKRRQRHYVTPSICGSCCCGGCHRAFLGWGEQVDFVQKRKLPFYPSCSSGFGVTGILRAASNQINTTYAFSNNIMPLHRSAHRRHVEMSLDSGAQGQLWQLTTSRQAVAHAQHSFQAHVVWPRCAASRTQAPKNGPPALPSFLLCSRSLSIEIPQLSLLVSLVSLWVVIGPANSATATLFVGTASSFGALCFAVCPPSGPAGRRDSQRELTTLLPAQKLMSPL